MAATSVRTKRKAQAKPDSLSYADFLEARLDEPGRRKGERTRDRLKAATTRLLDRIGYRELRVTDINEAAGVSNALFYVYFKNKEMIAEEVLMDFLSYFSGFADISVRYELPDASIYHGNLNYARMFRDNAGLMRCIFQFADEFPEFAAAWGAWNASWRARVVRSLSRARVAHLDAAELMLATAALGAMVDGVLRQILVQKDATLTPAELKMSAEELALFLTRLWVRGLFVREMAWAPEG